jgi:hypothetical protein
MSLEARLCAGGDDDNGAGESDFFRDDRLELREGVLYGVSVGVGNEAAAAAANSSSVSHAAMIANAKGAQQMQKPDSFYLQLSININSLVEGLYYRSCGASSID